jgi:hypothetical protein
MEKSIDELVEDLKIFEQENFLLKNSPIRVVSKSQILETEKNLVSS